MKKLDLNAISEEVLDECFGKDGAKAIEEVQSPTPKDIKNKISLQRPDGITNEDLISEIKKGIDVKKNTELLLRYNYGMIVSEAAKCTCLNPFEDKVSYGIEGFLRAINSYDPTKNTKFITYATASVYMTIFNESSNDNHMVYLPRYMSVHNITVNRFIDEYSKEHGRRPTDQQISSSTGIDIHLVKSCLLFQTSWTQLESKMSDDSDMTLGDIYTVDDRNHNLGVDSIKEPLKYVITSLVKELEPKECEIISRIHGLFDYKAQTIRELIGVFVDKNGNVLHSRSALHRNYTNAMNKLKRLVKRNGYEYEDF